MASFRKLRTTPTLGAVLAFAALAANSLHAQPNPAQLEHIAGLVESGKLDEAKIRTETLLEVYPADPALTEIYNLLNGKAPIAPASHHHSATTHADTIPINGMDRIAFDSIMQLISQVPDANPGKHSANLRRVLSESAPLVQKYPDQIDLWRARAEAALGLGDETAGLNAARHLLQLGAADSSNPTIHELLTRLNLKGWLDRGKIDALIAAEKMAAEKAEAERQAALAAKKAAEEQARFDATPEGYAQKLRNRLQGPVDPERIDELRKVAAELKSLAPQDTVPDAFLTAINLEKLFEKGKEHILKLNWKPGSESFRLLFLYCTPARTGDYTSALRKLDQLNYGADIDLANRNYFYGLLAEYQAGRGDVDACLSSLKSITNADSRWTSSLAAGRLLGKNGHIEKAKQAFAIADSALEELLRNDREMRKNYNRAHQLSNAGVFLADAGLNAEARESFKEAEKFAAKTDAKEELSLAWSMLGIRYASAGWISDATRALTKMSDHKVKNLRPMFVYGGWENAIKVRLEEGDESGARQLMANAQNAVREARSRFSSLDPTTHEISDLPWEGQAIWLAKQGRAKEAKNLYLKNEGKLRYNSDVFDVIIHELIKTGLIEDAQDLLAKGKLGFGTEDDISETEASVAYTKGRIAAGLLLHRGYVAAQSYTANLTDELSRYQAALQTAWYLTPTPDFE